MSNIREKGCHRTPAGFALAYPGHCRRRRQPPTEKTTPYVARMSESGWSISTPISRNTR